MPDLSDTSSSSDRTDTSDRPNPSDGPEPRANVDGPTVATIGAVAVAATASSVTAANTSGDAA